MKKVSTVAGRQSRKFSQPKLTIGLDLGGRSSWYCLLDEVGEARLEQKLGTTTKAMQEVFGKMPRCRIALDSSATGNGWSAACSSGLSPSAFSGFMLRTLHPRNLLWLSLINPPKADRFVDSLAGPQHEYKIVLGAALLSTVLSFLAAI